MPICVHMPYSVPVSPLSLDFRTTVNAEDGSTFKVTYSRAVVLS